MELHTSSIVYIPAGRRGDFLQRKFTSSYPSPSPAASLVEVVIWTPPLSLTVPYAPLVEVGMRLTAIPPFPLTSPYASLVEVWILVPRSLQPVKR